ncbi:MAG: hypothetical protein HDT15_05305 [Oscillibacter sp.]|nr:hypothetical protein [Oscillibacter sp.]
MGELRGKKENYFITWVGVCQIFLPPLRGGPGLNLILDSPLPGRGTGANFSNDGKVTKDRLGNYVS